MTDTASKSKITEAEQQTELHTFVYKRASGVEIKLDVHLPHPTSSSSSSSTSDSALPLLFWIHGGGNVQGRRQSVPPHMRRAVNRLRFALVSADYRLAPQVRLPDLLDDVADAYRWALSELPAALEGAKAKAKVDTQNVLVAGNSVGGFNALSLSFGLCPSLPTSSALLQRIRAVPIIYPITTFDAPFFALPQTPFMGALPDAELADPAWRRFVDPAAPVVANTDTKENAGDAEMAKRNKLYMYAQQTAPVSGFQQLVFGAELIEQGALQSSDTVRFLAARGAELNASRGRGVGGEGKGAGFRGIYVVHGTKDMAVEYKQATDLVDAGKKSGVQVQLETLEGIDQ